MKTIYLDFCHAGPKTPKQDHYFYRLLTKRFDVKLVDQPDFLIIGTQGRFREDIYTCTKIFYTYEHYLPNFRKHDYALTCNYLDDPRHYRLPVYVHYCRGGPETVMKRPEDLPQLMAQKTKFCALLTSNITTPTTKTRTEFFHRLSKYKKVDSGGTALNNIGHSVPWGKKTEFLLPYKFSIAFENESRPGYTSEKLFEAMQAHGVPLYWGNPRIKEEFNPKSFINYFDFESEEAMIEKIIELDKDDGKYFECLKQPYFYDNRPGEAFNEEKLLDFFEEIFDKSIQPASKRRSFFFGRWILIKKDK